MNLGVPSNHCSTGAKHYRWLHDLSYFSAIHAELLLVEIDFYGYNQSYLYRKQNLSHTNLSNFDD